MSDYNGECVINVEKRSALRSRVGNEHQPEYMHHQSACFGHISDDDDARGHGRTVSDASANTTSFAIQHEGAGEV